MAMTTFEKGQQLGQRLGQQLALRMGQQLALRMSQRTVLRKQLEARFGPLSLVARDRLESLGFDHLDALTLALLKAQSLQELGLED
jgi:hypothetical protein